MSDDGKLLVVATERANGSIVIYDLTNPLKPSRLTRYETPNTTNGVHTAEVARVNGTLYAFLSIDPPTARLVIVDLSDPTNPREVLRADHGQSVRARRLRARRPAVHGAVERRRDHLGHRWRRQGRDAGQPRADRERAHGTVAAVGRWERAHNVWWFHDAARRREREAVRVRRRGGTGRRIVLNSSNGDIHVVDVSDMAAPREVAFYHVDGAGTHNFSVDEQRGILYAAYYNAGVRALDVRGDLSACTADQKAADGRCDLEKMGRELAAGLAANGTCSSGACISTGATCTRRTC